MLERLQKIIASRGIASRRSAEKIIEDGRVTVNGQTALLGQSADPEIDEILLDGKSLPNSSDFVYILLNKPRGFVTTLSDEQGRRTVAQLVADCGVRVYPVGRLDLDSEGLLLLTNDGEFANKMMHPKHEVDKTYLAWVTDFSAEALEKVKMPISMDGYTIRPPQVRVQKAEGSHAQLIITIHEGRNRQVRRMCQAAGMHVTRLRRIGEGGLVLGDVPVGKWRHLTPLELQKLKGKW